MTRLQEIEAQILALTPDEWCRLRAWFDERDEEIWDLQIAEDVQAGRLDTIAAQALRDDRSGLSRDL